MTIQILGFNAITALPSDARPELDGEGFPLDRSITRAWTPASYPRALEGLEGGQEPDPMDPGSLGSRWYRLGDCVGSTFNASSSRLAAYRDELRELGDGAFTDLTEFYSADGILGPEACKRLAAAFRKYPDVDGQGQLHQELNDMIHEIAENGGCLVFAG